MRWTERMFRRLCTRLTRLISPVHESANFRIVIDSDEFPDYSGELHHEFLERAPYQLEGTFDGKENLDVEIGDRWFGEPWPGPGSLTCGPVCVRLFAFDLETPSLAKIGPNVEVRAWLREWSGVSVYRDGFRVWPYGEPHDDWLGLNHRRVNNPVVRLSNNQIIGFVEIARDRNPQLPDQTNREGLIHNTAFEDLRRLVHHLLLHLESHRQLIRHPEGEVRGTGAAAAEVGPLADLERLATTLPHKAGSQVRRVRKDLGEYLSRLETAQARTVQAYAEMAAAGRVLLTVAADLRAMLADVQAPGLKGIVELLERETAAVRSPASARSRRRTVDLEAELRQCLALLEARARRLGVAVKTETLPGGKLPRTELRPEVVHHLLLLLFEYGAHHLLTRDDRRVTFRVWATDDTAGFDCWFSGGRGLVASPGTDGLATAEGTTLESPAGGLDLVRKLCTGSGGQMRVLAPGRGDGVTFRLEFRRKQPRATR